MIRRICARLHPPPNASTVSPSPSSWKHPVKRTEAATEAVAAMLSGKHEDTKSNQRALMSPTMAPTRGNLRERNERSIDMPHQDNSPCHAPDKDSGMKIAPHRAWESGQEEDAGEKAP
eukprot:756758-Hanusia_phi.AAC.3